MRFWRLPAGTPAGTLESDTDYVECLAISPDGGLLAGGCRDGNVTLWRSALVCASQRPVGQLSAADIERLERARGERGEASERAWIELIASLGDWHRRHDIELAAAPRAVVAGELDIELDD